MTNKDFAIACNKFFYYAMNYPSNYVTYCTTLGETKTEILPEFFNAFDGFTIGHLISHWTYAYKSFGPRGALMGFYAELDDDNRVRLLKYINESYTISETFGIHSKFLDL